MEDIFRHYDIDGIHNERISETKLGIYLTFYDIMKLRRRRNTLKIFIELEFDETLAADFVTQES